MLLSRIIPFASLLASSALGVPLNATPEGSVILKDRAEPLADWSVLAARDGLDGSDGLADLVPRGRGRDREPSPSRSRRPAPPASPPPPQFRNGAYTKDEETWLKRKSGTVSSHTLLDALQDLKDVLDSKRITWMVSGGLGLKLHGQPRDTTDIDVVVDIDMKNLVPILQADRRFLLPTWRRDGHIRAYYVMQSRNGNKYVEIDFIVSGTLLFHPSW